MQRKKMCEINGRRYVTPGVFGDGIGWSKQKVTAACKEGRIIGACKDSSGNWIIPVETMKPLEKEQIRQLMVATVYLQNHSRQELDYSDHNDIVSVYTYLQQTGYIEQFDPQSDRIPYEITMTDKGIKLATEGQPMNLDWLRIGSTVIQVAASVLTIAQAI